MPKKQLLKNIKFVRVPYEEDLRVRKPHRPVVKAPVKYSKVKLSHTRIIALDPRNEALYSGVLPEERLREFENELGIRIKSVSGEEFRKKYSELIYGGLAGSHGTIDLEFYHDVSLLNCPGIYSQFNQLVKTLGKQGMSESEVHDFLHSKRKKVLYFAAREIPKEHQGKGVGSKFLDALEKIAKEEGIEVMYAETVNPIAEKTYHSRNWFKYAETRFEGVLAASFFMKIL